MSSCVIYVLHTHYVTGDVTVFKSKSNLKIAITLWVNYVPRKMPDVRSWYASYTNMRRFIYCMLHLMYECSAAFTIWSVSLTLIILFSHDILRENSSSTTYLGKLIIHIVLLQPPNTIYLPGVKVSDNIVRLCGDVPAWKCPDAELLHHTAFQNKFMRMQTL